MRRFWLAIAAACTLAAQPAAAQQQQPRQISAPGGANWTHERSGVAVPASLGDLRRVGITDLTSSEVDVAAHYEDGQSRVSIILFRPQITDTGLWFDRAERVLPLNPRLGAVTPVEDAPQFITPASGGAPIGLRRSYRGSGEWRSTATAMIQTGRWFVKIRASSANADVATVTRLVDAAIAGIRLPRSPNAGVTPLPRAAMPIRVVQACSDSVRWGSASVIADPSLRIQSALMLGLLNFAPGQAADSPADARPYAATPLCRDTTQISGLPADVYRVPGAGNHYFIAIGDSGALIDVRVAQRTGDQNAMGLATQLDRENSLAFPPFDGLPAPMQVIRMLQSQRPVGALNFDPERSRDRQLRVVTPG
jgi:hypothetical protein